MSHDFEPEPHEKAMIDVILKNNTTPKWIYDFNKFLIEERTTGEIIDFIQSLLTSHSEAIRERVEQEREELYKQILNVVDNEEELGVAPFMKRTLDRIRELLTNPQDHTPDRPLNYERD